MDVWKTEKQIWLTATGSIVSQSTTEGNVLDLQYIAPNSKGENFSYWPAFSVLPQSIIPLNQHTSCTMPLQEIYGCKQALWTAIPNCLKWACFITLSKSFNTFTDAAIKHLWWIDDFVKDGDGLRSCIFAGTTDIYKEYACPNQASALQCLIRQ